MEVFTIGFTKKSAKQFFEILRKHDIERLIDVRLNNISQLAGFTKRDDLQYLLKEVCGAQYVHVPLLAPTQQILDEYKKLRGSWKDYEEKFLALMRQRQVERSLPEDVFSGRCVLLCSEPTAQHCHRRLVLDYLSAYRPIRQVHL